MLHALYDALTPWYHLLDPRDDHADEAACFAAELSRALGSPSGTLLELGAGAGNNASFLQPAWRCTLVDLSPRMLELSRAQNPDAEHILGDMRDLRLGRSFDAVLIHDAIVYMRTEEELRAAIETAFMHTRPGGAAIFSPDCLRDTFFESSDMYAADDGDRALRCLEWSWDPDPDDDTYTVEYALLLRRDGQITAIHDTHVEGLFPEATWLRLLRDRGYTVEITLRPEAEAPYTDRLFVCRRPLI